MKALAPYIILSAVLAVLIFSNEPDTRTGFHKSPACAGDTLFITGSNIALLHTADTIGSFVLKGGGYHVGKLGEKLLTIARINHGEDCHLQVSFKNKKTKPYVIAGMPGDTILDYNESCD